ncbi:hypothetical protein ACHQM5_015899 [Ranunculus cassubicifolius]
MKLSTATVRTRAVSTLPRGLYSKCVSPSRSCLVKTSTRAFKIERLTAHTTLDRQSPVLKGAQIGFDPLRSRRNIQPPSALNARCAAAETQTLSRKSSASVVSPPGKETLPMLDDDGGSGFRGDGFTPYYRGDGSGGGSGGGGGGFPTSGEFPWGDYWFYVFLFLLRFLMMNIIGEGTCVYKYEDGRNKPIRRYV